MLAQAPRATLPSLRTRMVAVLSALSPRGRRLAVLVHDLVVAYLSFLVAVLLRQGDLDLSALPGSGIVYQPLFLAIFYAAAMACRMHSGVWSLASTRDLVTIARVVTVSLAAFYLCLFLLQRLEGIPRSLPFIQWFVLIFALAGSRLAYATWLAGEGRRQLRVPDWEPILLAGAGPGAAVLAQLLRPGAACACEAVGILDDRKIYQDRAIGGVPVLGTLAAVEAVIAKLAIHGMKPRRIVLTRNPDSFERASLAALEAAAGRHGVIVQGAVDLLRLNEDFAPARAHAGPPEELSLVRPRQGATLKRTADALIAGALLVLTLPVTASIALLVVTAIGRPFLFHQVRPGRNLHPFTLYKFRTLKDGHLADGRILSDDERQTVLGRLLRRSRLDELPQLWNVLVGEMSLIGPRPLLPRDLPDLGAAVQERFLVRPGMTGWAQVNGGHLLSPDEKLALDLWYIRRGDLLLDLRIAWKTAQMMLLGERIDRAAILQAWSEPMPPQSFSSGVV